MVLRGRAAVRSVKSAQDGRLFYIQLLRLQHRENILAARILMVLSASIIFALGVVHLVYTFWGPNLTPRDPALEISMSQFHLLLRKKRPCGGLGWASMPPTAWHLFCSA